MKLPSKTFSLSFSRYRLTVAILGAILGQASIPFHPARAAQPVAEAHADGVIRVRSAYGFEETVKRIEAAVAKNKIRFFGAIDQAKLAAGADIALPPSTLLLFGNPPLGIQFLTANRLAGLDWPVRMLVLEDERHQVWIAYTDFAAIRQRFGISDRDAAIAMASKVSALIASSAAAPSPAH